MLSPSNDLERRRPVWEALSELFFDTELDTQDYRRIALVLVNSKYSENELNLILRKEVAPVVSPNLSSVAGIWMGFDQKWLEAEILRCENMLFRWRSLFNNCRLIEEDWTLVLCEVRVINAG